MPQIATVKSGASLGVNDVAFGADELKAYPTLVTDVLNLETTVNERLTVNVFSVLGNRVHRSIGNKVDMSSLSSGLYIVKVRAGNKVSNIKVLK